MNKPEDIELTTNLSFESLKKINQPGVEGIAKFRFGAKSALLTPEAFSSQIV